MVIPSAGKTKQQRNGFRLRKMDVMLLRMIGVSKGQFVAVLTIIIMGIAAYTSLNMTSVNMNHTVTAYYSENNFPDLFLKTGAVPEQVAARLTSIDGVAEASGRVSVDVPMVTEDENERINLRLITTVGTNDELSRSTLLKGRLLKESGNEVMLIEQFAKARKIEVGDEIRIQTGEKQQKLKVVGIVANPEYIYLMENNQSIMPDEKNFGICYVSEKLGREAAGLAGSYNEILIRYQDHADEEALIDHVKDTLDSYGIRQVTKKKDQLSNSVIQQELKQLGSMASTIPVLFLFIAGLILMMLLSRIVKKDRIKIGILKSMGYQNGQVLRHYVKYAGLSGIIGGSAGAVLGMALAGGMTKLYLDYFNIPLLRINFYYSYLLYAILLSVGFCTVSGVIGARGAMKITPADAMRSEAPKAGKRILLEKIPFFWKRLSFSRKLVAKNLFRSKKRSLFVLTGILVTYGMMLFTTTMPDVMDQMMNEHFTEFLRMDYNIGLRTPVREDVLLDMTHLIETEYAEGKLEYPFELSNGNRKQSANIIGLNRNTKFFSFREINGGSINIPGNGILLTENLANVLDVRKGDTVLIKSYLPGRADVYLRVAGVVKQTLGINAYMDLDAMGQTLMEKNVINGFYLDSHDPDIRRKLLRAANVATVMSVADTRAVYDQYMTMTNISIGFMVLVSGILGFCIVYNATVVSLSEREMEFSSLRVLGFSKLEIFTMIVNENNVLLFFGILFGIPLGRLMAGYSSAAFSNDIYTIDMSPTPNAVIVAGLYTVGFIFLAQLATYRKIQKLDFLQVLKNRES